MTTVHGNHVKHTAIGAAAVFGLFIVAGVPLGQALPYALFVACPLMMVAMMLMMGRGQDRHGGCGHDHHDAHRDAHKVVDAERVDAAARR